MRRKKILFTGGGSAGHVSLNLAIIPLFIKEGWEVFYIGSQDGIERQLISDIKEVTYFPIHTGKFRRYFSWQNFSDIFKIIAGIIQSYLIIRKNNIDVIFSKGGFVSFPVVLGGWLNNVPVAMHESDLTPGLANKLSIPFASKVFTTFEETSERIGPEKSQCIGPIIRESLLQGMADRGLSYCGFTKEKPVLLVMGGSLGAKSINDAIRELLPELLKDFQIAHLCGKNQLDHKIDLKGYAQYEYVDKELPDIIAMSSIVVSRSGSNSIFEFLILRKPMVLIPLPLLSSRGDQISNAAVFKKKGFCEIVRNEDLEDRENLLAIIKKVYSERQRYIDNMQKAGTSSNCEALFEKIKNVKY